MENILIPAICILFSIASLGVSIYFFQKLREANSLLLSDIPDEIVDEFRDVLTSEIRAFREESTLNLRHNREELSLSFKSLTDTISNSLNNNQERIATMNNTMVEQLDKVKETVQGRLDFMQKENAKKLDEMQKIVDEKLQKTLEDRLSQSFKIVSDRLEQVHKGLGEMQNLATGVGDLKKVLSNVKSRGILGEIQLNSILENILTSEQYVKDYKPHENSAAVVEFAIKLPGKGEEGAPVFLPIDSKFPMESYSRLLNAYENLGAEEVKQEVKLLETDIKNAAKDISKKYINPPATTDFAIMFLPTEGLYAEIARNSTLLETLQRDYKVIISGPTTLSALLNSLQMGFRTLAIQQRSGEIWKILGEVKKEFGNFSNVLTSARKRIKQVDDELETLIGTRTRAINRRLSTLSEVSQELIGEGEAVQESDFSETDSVKKVA